MKCFAFLWCTKSALPLIPFEWLPLQKGCLNRHASILVDKAVLKKICIRISTWFSSLASSWSALFPKRRMGFPFTASFTSISFRTERVSVIRSLLEVASTTNTKPWTWKQEVSCIFDKQVKPGFTKTSRGKKALVLNWYRTDIALLVSNLVWTDL